MIQDFIDKFQEVRRELLKQFQKQEPGSYKDVLEQTLSLMFKEKDYGSPDFENIYRIDDGDYQGTLVFAIPERIYQPSKYWITKVNYGSCDVCDTFQACSTYGENPKRSAPEMVTMAMHMVQEMKEV